jgi:hypothetical protein
MSSIGYLGRFFETKKVIFKNELVRKWTGHPVYMIAALVYFRH